jgi:hypothetical protein
MKYKQTKIQYDDGSFEVSWIPAEFAHKNKKIIIGKNKMVGKKATVLEIYSDILYTADQIDINQRYPLKKVTDI